MATLLHEDGLEWLTEDGELLVTEDAVVTRVLSNPAIGASRGGGRTRPEKVIGGRWPGAPRYAAVLRIDGTYVAIEDPSTDQLDAASEAYYGGHLNVVDDTTATALEAAGYTVTSTSEDTM